MPRVFCHRCWPLQARVSWPAPTTWCGAAGPERNLELWQAGVNCAQAQSIMILCLACVHSCARTVAEDWNKDITSPPNSISSTPAMMPPCWRFMTEEEIVSRRKTVSILAKPRAEATRHSPGAYSKLTCRSFVRSLSPTTGAGNVRPDTDASWAVNAQQGACRRRRGFMRIASCLELGHGEDSR